MNKRMFLKALGVVAVAPTVIAEVCVSLYKRVRGPDNYEIARAHSDMMFREILAFFEETGIIEIERQDADCEVIR